MSRSPTALVLLLAIAIGVPAGATDWDDAVAAFDAGDYDAARRGFERYVASHPGFAGAHFMLARTLDRLGEPEASRLAYLRASDLDPGDPSYAFAAARTEIAVGAAAAALDRLARVDAARVDASTAGALAVLAASAQLKTGAPEAAVATLEHALESTPGSARLLAALGTARSSNGDLEGAVEAWRRAFGVDPSDAGSAASAVQAALDLANGTGAADADHWLDVAAEISGQLMAAEPGDGHALLAGRAFLAAGDLAAATAVFDAALAAGGWDDPLTLYYSGRALRCLNRLEEARGRFTRALSASPNPDLESSIHRQLARTAEALFDLDTAAEHHRKGGDSTRALQVEELAASFRVALAERREVVDHISQFEAMARDLDQLGEPDGAVGAHRRAAALQVRLAEIDANLEDVRRVLRGGGGCD